MQTKPLLRKSNSLPHEADGKALPGLCLMARELTPRALGQHLCKLFLHVCSSPDTSHHSTWRHSGHRAVGMHKKPQNKAESPASRCTPLRCRKLEAGGTKAARMLWQSCFCQHPPTPATHYSSTTGNRRSRPGGKAKNHSRRRADTETGEPRALRLPRSRVMQPESLLDSEFLMLTENSKLSFTPDLQILRRRRKRDKKKPGHLLKGLAVEKRAAHGDSPGRALVQLSG